jgi:hypothetical protein
MLDAWAANFSTLLTAAPMTYGQDAGTALNVAMVYATWSAAYALVTSPATKTASTVSAKNIARTSMLAIIRPVAQEISLSPGVTAGNKTAIGVNPRTSTPGPITPPGSNPVLSIAQALPLQHIVRYRDSIASPSVKSKPYGVIQCQIFGAASATPITDPTLLPLIAVSTKSPFLITWPSGDKGLNAYYVGRWIIRKGAVSAYGPITSFTIAA